jgi:uncharacterized membrane protein
MKNKTTGWIIIGIAVVIGVIVFLFNNAMTSIVNASCSHGPSCTMYDSIRTQTWISIIIIGVIALIGIIIMFIKPEEKIVTKKVEVEKKKLPINYSKLDKEEKVLVKVIEESEGSIFQADLVEKSGFDKVKVTRVLDRLEGKQIIERKRRGMTNVVLLR